MNDLRLTDYRPVRACVWRSTASSSRVSGSSTRTITWARVQLWLA